jgi:hypothetical protein
VPATWAWAAAAFQPAQNVPPPPPPFLSSPRSRRRTLASEREPPAPTATHGAPPRRLTLLLGLLALAATAATRGGAQLACEPSNLATQITLFCMPDMPTAPCCEPFVASVDLGGGVPYLCASPPSRSLSSPASTPPTSSRSTPPAGGCAPGAPTSPPPAKVRDISARVSPLSLDLHLCRALDGCVWRDGCFCER